MLAASVFFFFERGSVESKWKLSMLVSGLITGIAAVHHYYMRDYYMATGENPTAGSKVKVNYKGTLLSGETFDSSYDRGAPIDFQLNQVIPGWTEGIQLMKKGSRIMISGYNEKGSQTIDHYSLLGFTKAYSAAKKACS